MSFANGGDGKKVFIVARQLECARDEIKIRRLMQQATRDEVVIALDNLRMILERVRKNV